MPLRIARQRPTMTSSLMFSMIPAASPATKAKRIGAKEEEEKQCIKVLADFFKLCIKYFNLEKCGTEPKFSGQTKPNKIIKWP